MRTYEKFLLVPILACLVALAAIVAYPSGPAEVADTGRGGSSGAGKPSAGSTPGDLESEKVQDPDAGDAASYLLCTRQANLSRAVDQEAGIALAADEAGHLALYGTPGEKGDYTDDSFDILRGCLPQLAYTNTATVLVDGRGPEDAKPDNVARKTRKTEDGSLTTGYRFAGDVGLDQRLSLDNGALVVDYELANNSQEQATVSLRALVAPVADVGRQKDGRDERFVTESPGGERTRAVTKEDEVSGGELGAVRVPRRGAASDSSGRLVFGGGRSARPDVAAFAGTLDLTAADFRYEAAARDDAGWPLPPSSSIAAYWLYEEIPAGGSVTFSYRYEPSQGSTAGDSKEVR